MAQVKAVDNVQLPPRFLRAGAVTGAAAGIIAALVQLPLNSPSDTLFNSASVVIGSLAAGVIAGYLWQELFLRDGRSVFAIGIWALVLGAVCLGAVWGETQLERTLSYSLPLAGIVFAVTGLATPRVAALSPIKKYWWPVAVIVVVALAVGFGLASIGDAPSGHLELPPRAN